MMEEKQKPLSSKVETTESRELKEIPGQFYKTDSLDQ